MISVIILSVSGMGLRSLRNSGLDDKAYYLPWGLHCETELLEARGLPS